MQLGKDLSLLSWVKNLPKHRRELYYRAVEWNRDFLKVRAAESGKPNHTPADRDIVPGVAGTLASDLELKVYAVKHGDMSSTPVFYGVCTATAWHVLDSYYVAVAKGHWP